MLTTCRKKIDREIYERAQARNGVVCREDQVRLFSSAELYGYGVFGAHAIEVDGEYFCEYETGDSCD